MSTGRLRLHRSALLVALVLVSVAFAWLTPSASAEFRKGRIIMNDGRVIEGDIEERGRTVVVRLAFGEVPYTRDRIKAIEYEDAGGEGGGADGVHWIIRLKDGSVLTAESFEDRGQNIVARVGGAEVIIPKSDLLQPGAIEKRTSPAGGGGAAGPGPTDPDDPQEIEFTGAVFRDFEAGFAVRRPDDEWVIVGRSPEPMIRASLSREVDGVGAEIEVQVIDEELDPFREVDAKKSKQLAGVLNDQMKKRYAKSGTPKVTVKVWNGLAVYESTFSAQPAGRDKQFDYVETRIFAAGQLYVIRGWAPKLDGSTLPKVQSVLDGFSLLGALVFTPDAYVDLESGFAVYSPNDDWRLDIDLFDRAHPVRFLLPASDQAYANLEVEIETAEEDALAKTRMNTFIAQRKEKSRYFELQGSPVDRSDDGVEIIEIAYLDFPPGGDKLENFRHTIARVDSGFVHVRTRASRDPEAERARDDTAAVHRRFHPVSESRLHAQIENQSAALDDFHEGWLAFSKGNHENALASFERAAGRFDRFARAWFLASRSAEKLKRFEDAQRFREEAQTRDPTGDWGGDSSEIMLSAARSAFKSKRFEEAVRYFKAAGGMSLDEKDRGDYVKAYLAWAKAKKGFEDREDVYKKAMKDSRDNPAVENAYYGMLMSWASALQKKKDFRGAKRQAKEAKKVTSNPKNRNKAEAFLNKLAEAEAKERGR